MRRRDVCLGAAALAAVAACASQNPAGYKPSLTEQALTGSVYRGEWKKGFLYEITFKGVGSEMTAMVHVIDSDAARTEYRMPARVEVTSNEVKLRFTKFDRVDHLSFEVERVRLTGYTVYKGQEKPRLLWAEKVET